MYNEKQEAQQDCSCWVVISESDRCVKPSFSFWTCRLRVKIVFPFPLSIGQIKGMRTEQIHLTYNVHSLLGNRTGKKSTKSDMFNYSRSEFGPHLLMTQGSSFRQCNGAAINLAFPTVPAFRSFWLSGHSSFLVITAVPSFWLFSGRSSHWKQKINF